MVFKNVTLLFSKNAYSPSLEGVFYCQKRNRKIKMRTQKSVKSKRSSRVCSRSLKRRFRDHKEAIRALHGARAIRNREIELTGGSNRNELRTYSCPDCIGWHLTSQPKRTQKKVAA